jgi:hypothetical protein
VNKVKCRYQDQDASITLAEGVDEYYQANPHLLLPQSTDPAALFFLCHDRIHVVFGCNTSFLHEVRTDLWTILGSDIGLVKYANYIKSPAIKLLYKDVQGKTSKNPTLLKEIKADIKSSMRSVLAAPFHVFNRTRKMKKKWPWFKSENLMDRPLNELRAEYGIKVFE